MPSGHADWQANPTEGPANTVEGAITRTVFGTGSLSFGVAAGNRVRILAWRLGLTVLTEAAAGGMSLVQAQTWWEDGAAFTVRDEMYLMAGAPASGVGSAELTTGWVRMLGAGIVLGDGVGWIMRLNLTDFGAAAPTRVRAAMTGTFLRVLEVV